MHNLLTMTDKAWTPKYGTAQLNNKSEDTQLMHA